jgi:hypothetical protein
MSKREIVEIRLGRKSDGSIARDAAFMVFADDPDRAAKAATIPAKRGNGLRPTYSDAT